MKTHYYNQPLYAIFAKINGQLCGWVEHSFSMDWSPNYVRVWPKDYLNNVLNNKKVLTKWVGRDCFLVRVKSKKSPVDITLQKITKEMHKFEFRNKTFKIKQ